MTDREKLIALIDEYYRNAFQPTDRKLTAYLLANGVVVREWIPVTERLPGNGEMVLCNTSYFVEVLQWDERAGVWCGQHRGYHKSYVTHWMPLPEPPMRKGENG